ncbi:predicted protein [Botrytis cinerea T4]|uniref:Uncharacterized protein n=1 Tax=Botryotinia fuckeliana (strain T4) TaxID=999810 RepID=G2YD96_BOTF4|nr:predicted protein [Botrytis cinerea T4]
MNTSMDTGSSDSSPPDDKSPSNVPRTKFQNTPEAGWTNHKCRDWLEDYFSTMCGYQKGVAESKALNFMGSGMSMYMMSIAEWKTLMGVCEGSGIFGILMKHNKYGKYCFHTYNTRKNGSMYY